VVIVAVQAEHATRSVADALKRASPATASLSRRPLAREP
jgi:hypothetical protein